MQVKFKIGAHSSSIELNAAAVFLNTLAFSRDETLPAPALKPVHTLINPAAEAPKVYSPEAEGYAAEQSEQMALPKDDQPAAPPAVTRRRRTKAEVEADKAAEAAAAEAVAATVTPESAAAEAAAAAAEPVVETPAAAEPAAEVKTEKVDTATGEITTVVASGKTFTAPDVQSLAAVVARTKGPALVKNKIASFGADRIAALNQEQLNELGDFLEANKD